MSAKAYLNILRIGAYSTLVTVFFVFKNLLFPYITSKQISFNIIVELLLIFWLALIVKYPEYRPKKNFISFGLLGFFAALVLSCFTSLDFNLSFWGDVERMLGVFHLLHFLGFYFIIITVFREWKDWKILFIASTLIAVIVSLIGLNDQRTNFSTIGNTAYVSGYLIFNMYFCFILFFRENNKMLRWLYLIPIIFYLFEFKKADTTGALVGLSFSIIVLFFMYGVLSKNTKLRYGTLGLAVALVLLGVVVVTNKDKPFIIGNPLLRPFAEISFERSTFQTRLISWKAAAKDFKNHPILGTGFGNYAIIFDKYFDPSFYNYTRSETYFDRAHNNLVDIASTTGVVGLVTYLSIFIAAGYYLISGYRRDKIGLHEFIFITCLLIAYFVQNLAVFDSLVTYVGCMIILAYIFWLSEREEDEEEAEDRALENKEIYSLALAGVVLLTIMYQYNYKPYKMLDLTIGAQIIWQQGQIEETYKMYKKALAYDTVLDRDSITSMNRLFAGSPTALSNIDRAKAQEILEYNVQMAEKNVKYNPGDSLNQMMYAQVLDITAYYNSNDQQKFAFYSDRALEAIDKSIAASPGRVPIYYQKAQILMNRGEKEKVLETLKYAYDLNPKYYDSPCYLANTYLFYKDEAKAYEYFDKCIDLDGIGIFRQKDLIQSLIQRYEKLNDTKKLINLYLVLAEIEPKDYRIQVTLAQLYAKDNQKDKAINAANKAAEISPAIKDYADQFIKTLE